MKAKNVSSAKGRMHPVLTILCDQGLLAFDAVRDALARLQLHGVMAQTTEAEINFRRSRKAMAAWLSTAISQFDDGTHKDAFTLLSSSPAKTLLKEWRSAGAKLVSTCTAGHVLMFEVGKKLPWRGRQLLRERLELLEALQVEFSRGFGQIDGICTSSSEQPAAQSSVQLPHPAGYCPLTKKIMKHPWSTPSAVSYERDALRDWVTEHQKDPITESPLQWSQCVRNETLEKILPKMMRMHQTLTESSCVKDREDSMASNGAQQSKPSENDRRNLEKLLSLLTHSDDSHGFVPKGHELVLVRLLFGLCLCLWRMWSLCSRTLCRIFTCSLRGFF
eukprot:INCI2973.2.p1 GENE.INCI2973.2~~INCI2973.2.p1  ORF type:complete len:333 (-),score=44.31 INCI2973.2:824-1822(-)